MSYSYYVYKFTMQYEYERHCKVLFLCNSTMILEVNLWPRKSFSRKLERFCCEVCGTQHQHNGFVNESTNNHIGLTCIGTHMLPVWLISYRI